MGFYRSIVRPIFFLLPPETAHHVAMAGVRFALWCAPLRWLVNRCLRSPRRAIGLEVEGLVFPNLVGVAAGFDKEGLLADGARHLGFGFIEIGTVPPRPQPGNPKPRLFRLPKDRALINRMGFNSIGAEAVAGNLAMRPKNRIPVGGSIGKNTNTPNEGAVADYCQSLKILYPLVDFFVVNVSCPNVHSLTELQRDESLLPLVRGVREENERQGGRKPIFLKLAPHAEEVSLRATVRLALQEGITGFVAINTSPRREGLATAKSHLDAIGNGGLSGRPIFEEALRTVRIIRQEAGSHVPIIGVGGVFTGEDALKMLRAGASLVQVFTGFIYQGPWMARGINRYLLKHIDEVPVW